MTPQLQQAIRLLQLSTLDLKQEIQEALDSNLMLETEEEGNAREPLSGADSLQKATTEEICPNHESDTFNDINNEREINAEANTLPDELPVDSNWEDLYDSILPPSPGSQRETSDDGIYFQYGRVSQTLHDHLIWQMNLTPFSDLDRAIATAIIDAVNENGYLSSTLEDIMAALSKETIHLDELEAVLHRIQCFDPPGVAARGPRECLLLQLHQLPEKTPYLPSAIRLLDEQFDLLVRQDHAQIKRRLKWTDEDLSEINQLICSLNPRPGNLVADAQPQYVIPDVFVTRKDNQWWVELNPDSTPRLRINPDYAKLIRRADSNKDNTCLKNHMQEARWFIKSLHSRNDTLLRVATKIVEYQRGFFNYGEEAMRPLVLRDIADTLDLHESTVSRVTTQKYMHTPRGTLEFKYFFSSHVSTTAGGECSATAIRALIKKLVAAEKSVKPLSDNKIACILANQGIKVARRTVAKYRESMAIPPSNERKRLA